MAGDRRFAGKLRHCKCGPQRNDDCGKTEVYNERRAKGHGPFREALKERASAV